MNNIEKYLEWLNNQYNGADKDLPYEIKEGGASVIRAYRDGIWQARRAYLVLVADPLGTSQK